MTSLLMWLQKTYSDEKFAATQGIVVVTMTRFGKSEIETKVPKYEPSYFGDRCSRA